MSYVKKEAALRYEMSRNSKPDAIMSEYLAWTAYRETLVGGLNYEDAAPIVDPNILETE
jgi:hypothetical protein